MSQIIHLSRARKDIAFAVAGDYRRYMWLFDYCDGIVVVFFVFSCFLLLAGDSSGFFLSPKLLVRAQLSRLLFSPDFFLFFNAKLDISGFPARRQLSESPPSNALGMAFLDATNPDAHRGWLPACK